MVKKKGTIEPRIPSNFKKFIPQDLKIEIKCEDAKYLPDKLLPNCYNLKANLPCDIHGVKRIDIAPNYYFLIDCGFSLDLPSQYLLDLRLVDDLLNKGVVGTIWNNASNLFQVHLFNAGRDIISLEDACVFASFRVLSSLNFSLERSS